MKLVKMYPVLGYCQQKMQQNSLEFNKHNTEILQYQLFCYIILFRITLLALHRRVAGLWEESREEPTTNFAYIAPTLC